MRFVKWVFKFPFTLESDNGIGKTCEVSDVFPLSTPGVFCASLEFTIVLANTTFDIIGVANVGAVTVNFFEKIDEKLFHIKKMIIYLVDKLIINRMDENSLDKENTREIRFTGLFCIMVYKILSLFEKIKDMEIMGNIDENTKKYFFYMEIGFILASLIKSVLFLSILISGRYTYLFWFIIVNNVIVMVLIDLNFSFPENTLTEYEVKCFFRMYVYSISLFLLEYSAFNKKEMK